MRRTALRAVEAAGSAGGGSGDLLHALGEWQETVNSERVSWTFWSTFGAGVCALSLFGNIGVKEPRELEPQRLRRQKEEEERQELQRQEEEELQWQDREQQWQVREQQWQVKEQQWQEKERQWREKQRGIDELKRIIERI